MDITKIYPDPFEGGGRLYSVLLSEDELRWFSSKALQVVRGIKKASNRAGTKLKNGKNAIVSAITKKPKAKIMPKSNFQLNRETLQTRNAAAKALDTPITQHLDKGIKTTLESPVAVGSNIVNYGVLPSINPALAAAPLGEGGVVAEAFLKNKSRLYKNATEKLGNSYKNSHMSKYLREADSPSVGQLFGRKKIKA